VTKSGKQRQAAIKAQRASRAARRGELDRAAERSRLEAQGVLVNEAALAPNNSYGAPEFERRGYYVDMPFRCKQCGKEEVWTATQQKWWYEVAKGYAWSTAVLCRACRPKEGARRAEARRVHLEGVARKKKG